MTNQVFSRTFFVCLASCLVWGPGCKRDDSSSEGPRIGAILMQQDQFFRLNEQGMRAAAEELGVDLRVQNAAGALDKEISLVETFVTQGVDAILVSPLSSRASIPALRRAHEEGIRIITYNNSLDAEFPVCTIASDQVELGASTGRAVRTYIDNELGGKARVAIIGFASQLPEQGGARLRGFKEEIGKLPGVEIVSEQDAWTAPKAATAVGEILSKTPDIVWAANEGGTVGAVTAVRNAGLAGKVAVFGTDISNQLADFLLSDDGILRAVTAQKPFEMGRIAVEIAVEALNGESTAREKTLPGVLFSRRNREDVEAYQQRLAELSS